jgi:hypothetical protein
VGGAGCCLKISHVSVTLVWIPPQMVPTNRSHNVSGLGGLGPGDCSEGILDIGFGGLR